MCNVRGGVLPTWRAPPSAPLNNLHSCSIKRRSRFLIRTCLICFPGCRRAQQHAEGNHAHCVGPLKENCKQPSAIGSSQGCASRRARVRGWPESMRSTVLQNIAAEEWPLHSTSSLPPDENARPSALLQIPTWHKRHKQTKADRQCRVSADRQKLASGNS